MMVIMQTGYDDGIDYDAIIDYDGIAASAGLASGIKRIYRKHTAPKPPSESNRSRAKRFRAFISEAISPHKNVEQPPAVLVAHEDEVPPSIEAYTAHIADSVDAFIIEQENLTKSKRMAALRDDEEILLILS